MRNTTLASAWNVLRYALGPAVRGTPLIARWWGVVVAAFAGAGAIVGAIAGLGAAWLIAGAVAVFALLFFRSALHFYNEAHPQFPLHDLQTHRPWHMDLPDVIGGRRRTLVVHIEYTNRDVRRVNLDFQLLLVHVRQRGLSPVTLSNYRGTAASAFISPPLAVAPEHLEQGELAFEAMDLGLEFGDDHELAVDPRFRLALRITDRVSRATTEHPLRAERIENPDDNADDQSGAENPVA